jgi:hypothetical protein
MLNLTPPRHTPTLPTPAVRSAQTPVIADGLVNRDPLEREMGIETAQRPGGQ